MINEKKNIEYAKNSILSRLNRNMGSGAEPVRDLLNLDDIKGKTVITDYERMLLTQIRFLGEKFNISFIKEFVQDYEEYGISVDGLSRAQFVAVHTQPEIRAVSLPNSADFNNQGGYQQQSNRKM